MIPYFSRGEEVTSQGKTPSISENFIDYIHTGLPYHHQHHQHRQHRRHRRGCRVLLEAWPVA